MCVLFEIYLQKLSICWTLHIAFNTMHTVLLFMESIYRYICEQKCITEISDFRWHEFKSKKIYFRKIAKVNVVVFDVDHSIGGYLHLCWKFFQQKIAMCVSFKLHYDSFAMHLVLLKMCANVTIKQKQTKLKALWTSQKSKTKCCDGKQAFNFLFWLLLMASFTVCDLHNLFFFSSRLSPPLAYIDTPFRRTWHFFYAVCWIYMLFISWLLNWTIFVVEVVAGITGVVVVVVGGFLFERSSFEKGQIRWYIRKSREYVRKLF